MTANCPWPLGPAAGRAAPCPHPRPDACRDCWDSARRALIGRLCPELNPLELGGAFFERRLLDVVGEHAPTEWATADGTVRLIVRMEDDHLRNALLMQVRVADALRAARLVRHDAAKHDPILAPRGDLAQDEFDRAGDELVRTEWPDHVRPVFWDMLAEARHRGLTGVAREDLDAEAVAARAAEAAQAVRRAAQPRPGKLERIRAILEEGGE